MDVLSLVEVGIKSAISVPNGANDNDNYWLNSIKYLDDIKRFVIATDMDDKGLELREKIAHRLGKYRCQFVDFEGKDANDDLIAGVLKNTVKNKKRFPVDGVFTAMDMKDEVICYLYKNGLPETLSPKGEWFGDWRTVFRVMRGQLILPTGIPSHGKSTFVDWYVLNLINDHNLKASWFSPEHSPLELYESEFIQKVTGKNFWTTKHGGTRVTHFDIELFENWSDEKIYFTDCGESKLPTWTWLFETMTEQIMGFGIDVFVIDAFNKILLPDGQKLDQINKVLTQLTHFCRVHNVIVFLVAHPTKNEKNRSGKL